MEQMKSSRRNLLRLTAGAAALQLVSRVARAQTYPSRPVRIIVGFPPGGGVDMVARLTAQRLSERLGQQFIIENRPGAAGNIAAETLVRATPDGYTLAVISVNNAINAALYEKLTFNFVRDIAPVAAIDREPIVMAVHPSFPAKTIPELIAYARANPGKINFASSGNGTVNHVAGELFKAMAGVNMVHVPYRGMAPALTDLLGGQVQVAFASVASSIEYVKAAKLRALAVTTTTPLPALPDVPVVADFVPGYEVSGWNGVGAPKNTPAEIINRLNREINAALADPNIKARLDSLGNAAFPLSPADFGNLIAGETDKWDKVVKFAGIKAE
jgi:tripartite-type tricarboxylate transporter receptor subunit TctC